MAISDVIYTRKEHIGHIVLPGKECILKPSIALEIVELCSRINGDGDINVVLVFGLGGPTCSNLKKEKAGEADSVADIFQPPDPCGAIGSLDCPTIAVIEGEVLNERLELALACDLRIASDKARFGLSQITSGLIPMNGGTQRLSRTVGKGKTLEMVLCGEIIDAPAALEMGLINKVVISDRLISEAEAMARNLAAKAHFALRYCKEAINKGLDMTLEQGLRLEADLYCLLHTTEDRSEGIRSFLEKRPPQYKGE
jgi:enoyl-CoA hydratase